MSFQRKGKDITIAKTSKQKNELRGPGCLVVKEKILIGFKVRGNLEGNLRNMKSAEYAQSSVV